jgi:CheY-like chemotaxis protein
MTVRCIIVDDSPDFAGAARSLLERQGISVVGIVSTGVQACRACRELRPDVVLLDVELGDETGFDVASALARWGGAALPPQPQVILISAHPADEFEDMIASTPALSFLPKAALSGAAIRGVVGSAGPAAADGA